MTKEIILYCSECKKPLIHRLSNGLWHFAFGKRKCKGNPAPAIDMYIQGNIKIRCWHGECLAWNVLNYFPKKND